MRILQFSAERFRSLRSVSNWQPGALNVLIGPNASGKSNVLRALDFLAASAQGRLSKTVQSVGGMEPLLWDGRDDDFGLSLNWSPKSSNVDESEMELNYGLVLRRKGRGGDFDVVSEALDISEPRPKNGNERVYGAPWRMLDRRGTNIMIYDSGGAEKNYTPEDVPPQESMLSLAKGPFFKNTVLTKFRAELAGFTVYHDFHTNRDASIRQPAVTRYEERVDSDGQNLVSVLHTLYTGNRDFKNEVNDAMTAAFGPDFEELVFPPASDQRTQLRIRWRSLQRAQSAAELSDGTLRFLFLLSVLASPDPAPVIAIDEPETGLHPSMLPIIAEFAVEASRKTQVFLTTHSPQLLDAFTGTRPTTTVVTREAGETRLVRLDETELNRWLEEYTLGSLHQSGELEGMAS